MKKYFFYLLTLTFLTFFSVNTFGQGSCADGSFQWSDIETILTSAGCNAPGCHGGNPGSSGLNMTTYANFTAGGNQCGTTILSGTQFVDIINVGNQTCAGGTINNPMNNLVGGAITAQQSADIQTWIDAGAPEMCPPPSTCPTVILNDNNLPTLPPAVCADELLSLCFDVAVDEATFDPTLVQFNYDLTIGGAPSTVTLNTSYVSGGGIDPAATGQLCFEANVPAGADPCAPYELSLEIIEVFYNDPGCANNTVAYDLNITTPIPLMQMGDDLNALIPLLGIAGLNPILVQIYPNPNWTAAVTQVPACDGATLGIIEISAADGTVCETLTDIGTAGMDGCPPTDAILPETLYENYTTFTDANGVEQPNPCAVSITIPEQTIACEDQCIMCPTVVSAEQEPSVCQDAGSIQFCVTFDMVVDVNTVLTVEGISVDGSAGGTQICVDVPFTPPFDPCNGAAIDFIATAICDGTDLLAGSVWLGTQILPITDPACGGIAGCTDATACNFNPNAVCDDPANPCIPAPTCNTDPCVGDTEIVDPADPCQCIVDQVQVLGCTDANACNYDMAANCDDGTCDLGNTMCPDPCNPPNPDDGCDLTTDTFDAATCTVTNTPPDPNDGCDLTTDAFDVATCTITNTPNCGAGETFDSVNCLCTTDPVPGCTNACADNYDPNATTDDGSCMFPNPDDDCDLTVDSYDDVNCVVINEAPNPDDGCDLTTDAFDAATCMITNTPNCAAGETFDAANCLCTTDPVSGCTNMCADNYNPDATIDDGSCMFPNPDDGCDLTVDSYDDVNCVVINEAPNPDDGCDLTTDVFDATTCMITNMPNCAAGETFDAANCMCVGGGIAGCLDPCDPNFDMDATIDDPSLCAGYDTTCNTDCLMGDLTIWDAATCSCVVDVVTVLGCTDSTADNYDPAANCDDGSCTAGPCEDMIAGTVIAEETGCSAAGIEVTIYDSTGSVIGTATTDANGNYTLMGLYDCGDYMAELTDGVPSCYSDSGGVSGPIGFTVNGDGVADGANFSENPQVPTLSQWGLIVLALLLMTLGALKLGYQKRNYLKPIS